ncbi:hypothetical protein JTB14_028526 [Gonioctena quinquepunctata]|nr:hypothetical protein JTB14_028526 [Gonioctena quinquepunctata]
MLKCKRLCAHAHFVFFYARIAASAIRLVSVSGTGSKQITELGNKAQNFPKPTQAGPAGKPQELPTSSNKEGKEGKNKKSKNPQKGEKQIQGNKIQA